MNIDSISALMQRARRVHLIGIGGVSMSSLAQILHTRHYTVSGSDRTAGAVTDRLLADGIDVKIGHDASYIDGADVIVYTAAIPASNPELSAASAKSIPTLTRGELLGWLMLGYRLRIGVAGTHGKSTTTSMLAMILLAAKVDPTVISGANLPEMGGSYRLGREEYFLFEACEYKDSFLSFFPTTAVIGNVELDHVDYFGTLARMKQSFSAYLSRARIGVLNADDPDCISLARDAAGQIVTFGIDSAADYRAEELRYGDTTVFTLTVRGVKMGCITLTVPGRHNVLNALSACAAAMENGIGFDAVKNGLAAFKGASRRFDLRGYLPNAVPVYDDYAHHPSEIQATLTAAKATGRRVVCVFQPHTYSRTAALFEGFVHALSLADVLLLCPIYAAREVNTFGVRIEDLAERIDGALALTSLSDAPGALEKVLGEGDLVLLMGAGDVCTIASMLPLTQKCEV